MSRNKKTVKKAGKTAKVSNHGKALKQAVSQLLRNNEAIIAFSEGKFVEAGTALKAIREDEQYKAAGFKNFETYCEKKWGYSKSYASRLIGAAEVFKFLEAKLSSRSPKPTNENQVRPLTELSRGKVVTAWKRAVEKSKGKKVAGETVREVVNAMLHRKSAQGKDAAKNRKPAVASKLVKIKKLARKALTKKVMASKAELVKLVKQIRDLQKNKNVTVIESAEEYYPSIWLNHRIAPFSSKNARLAVSYAIDRVDYTKVRQRNYTSPAKSIVGPNNIMYNEKGYIQYDLQKAKDAAAAYKAETGKDLEFSFPYTAGSTESLANATQIQKYMTAAGIKMNLLPLTTAEIIQRAFPQQFQAMALLLMEGTGTAFIAPFIISDTSGGNLTHVLRPTPLRVLYGILNLSAFTDTTSDELIWQAKATANAAARKKVYARATELLQSEARLTNITYLKYALAYRGNVHGVGELGLVNGGPRKLMTNFGIDFTGVWKSGK